LNSILPAARLKNREPQLSLFSERGGNQLNRQNYAQRTCNTRTINIAIAVQRLLSLVGQVGVLTLLRRRIANHVTLHRHQ
jgi:hypothetical protein